MAVPKTPRIDNRLFFDICRFSTIGIGRKNMQRSKTTANTPWTTPYIVSFSHLGVISSMSHFSPACGVHHNVANRAPLQQLRKVKASPDQIPYLIFLSIEKIRRQRRNIELLAKKSTGPASTEFEQLSYVTLVPSRIDIGLVSLL